MQPPIAKKQLNLWEVNVLIVTHGRTLTALHILFTKNLQTEINTFKHPNTSLYKYEFNGQEFINTIHKDLTHLELTVERGEW